MPNWYWEKKELRSTPSQTSGYLDFETESRYRREGVRFILEMGKSLNLSHTTMASGAVYFHRFYMFHSFQEFPRYVVAACCLFLAGKAEETPKKCKDIVKTVRSLTNDRQFATFGSDPREEIMVLERVLLQTIKFDLQVEHPYSSLIKYAKCLKGDKNKLQKMVQMSWTFVNDSLCTTLCLQWEPEIIAIALMYLAAKLSKFEVKDWNDRKEWHKHWWDQYVEELDVELLEDICHQVLDLYTPGDTATKDKPDSPPPEIPRNKNQLKQPKTPGSASSSTPGSRKTTPPPLPPPLPPSVQPPPPPPPQSKSRPQTPPPPPPPPPPLPEQPPPPPPPVPVAPSKIAAAIGAPPAAHAMYHQYAPIPPVSTTGPPQPPYASTIPPATGVIHPAASFQQHPAHVPYPAGYPQVAASPGGFHHSAPPPHLPPHGYNNFPSNNHNHPPPPRQPPPPPPPHNSAQHVPPGAQFYKHPPAVSGRSGGAGYHHRRY